MALQTFLLLLLTAAAFESTYADSADHYRAAVVGYQVLQNSSSARENLMSNVRAYEDFIKKAKDQQADIIVFPEEGLLGGDNTIFLVIPDPSQKIVPNASYDESLQTLSGYAKNYSMYIAVNLHENYTDPSSNKSFKYNTNIVFDNNGTIIARYRKYNLYGEPVDRPEKPEYSVFTAFNVTFGQFICFDILFQEAVTLITKYNVTNVIYPSKWYSELPFLTSVQTQWSWSVGNNINLLSAGTVNVTAGNSGSGIFRGKRALNNLFSFTDSLGNSLLIGNVPKSRGNSANAGDYNYESYEGSATLPLMQQPNMNQFASADITLPSNSSTTTFIKRICHEKLCCNFNLTVNYYLNPSVHYKAVVFNGKRTFGATGKTEYGEQVCGVVLCANGSLASCGQPAVNGVLPKVNVSTTNVQFTSIKIKGNFLTNNANPLPNVLLWPTNINNPKSIGTFLLTPNKVNFTSNNAMSSLDISDTNEIITVAIHSRVFSTGNGASLMEVSIVSLIISVFPLLMRNYS